MNTCQHCAASLSTNEIAISLRLLGRDGQTLRCRDCLAKELNVSPEVIDRKIRQFKELGCPLFV